MRIETTTKELYNFDELSDEAQDKAVEKLADINVDDEWWECDGMLDLSAQEMKDRHMSREYMNMETMLFSYNQIYFEGVGYSRNQYIQFPDVQVNNYEVFRKFLRIPSRLWEVCDWQFETPTGYGYNAGTTELTIKPDKWDERLQDYTDFTDKQQDIIDRAIGIMNDKITESLSNLSTWYDDLTSEKGIIETIKANEYEFTADGEL